MEQTLKEYLETMSAALDEYNAERKNMKYKSMYDFILKNGREMHPIPYPEALPRYEPKQCYFASICMARDFRYRYVEGCALSGVLPLQHAWVLDSDGHVLDPTWQDGKEYFGVEFPFHYVWTIVMAQGHYGPIIDTWKLGWPLLTGKHKYPIPGTIGDYNGI